MKKVYLIEQCDGGCFTVIAAHESRRAADLHAGSTSDAVVTELDVCDPDGYPCIAYSARINVVDGKADLNGKDMVWRNPGVDSEVIGDDSCFISVRSFISQSHAVQVAEQRLEDRVA